MWSRQPDSGWSTVAKTVKPSLSPSPLKLKFPHLDHKTGKEARLVNGEQHVEDNSKPVRTHWDMLLERRSIEELEESLKQRLNALRERRGEEPLP